MWSMELELGPAGQVFHLLQWHLLRGLGVLIRALRLRSLLIELSADCSVPRFSTSPVQLAMINSLQLCPCHRWLLCRRISHTNYVFVAPLRVAK